MTNRPQLCNLQPNVSCSQLSLISLPVNALHRLSIGVVGLPNTLQLVKEEGRTRGQAIRYLSQRCVRLPSELLEKLSDAYIDTQLTLSSLDLRPEESLIILEVESTLTQVPAHLRDFFSIDEIGEGKNNQNTCIGLFYIRITNLHWAHADILLFPDAQKGVAYGASFLRYERDYINETSFPYYLVQRQHAFRIIDLLSRCEYNLTI